jgi:hypothetical protein
MVFINGIKDMILAQYCSCHMENVTVHSLRTSPVESCITMWWIKPFHRHMSNQIFAIRERLFDLTNRATIIEYDKL